METNVNEYQLKQGDILYFFTTSLVENKIRFSCKELTGKKNYKDYSISELKSIDPFFYEIKTNEDAIEFIDNALKKYQVAVLEENGIMNLNFFITKEGIMHKIGIPLSEGDNYLIQTETDNTNTEENYSNQLKIETTNTFSNDVQENYDNINNNKGVDQLDSYIQSSTFDYSNNSPVMESLASTGDNYDINEYLSQYKIGSDVGTKTTTYENTTSINQESYQNYSSYKTNDNQYMESKYDNSDLIKGPENINSFPTNEFSNGQIDNYNSNSISNEYNNIDSNNKVYSYDYDNTGIIGENTSNQYTTTSNLNDNYFNNNNYDNSSYNTQLQNTYGNTLNVNEPFAYETTKTNINYTKSNYEYNQYTEFPQYQKIKSPSPIEVNLNSDFFSNNEYNQYTTITQPLYQTQTNFTYSYENSLEKIPHYNTHTEYQYQGQVTQTKNIPETTIETNEKNTENTENIIQNESTQSTSSLKKQIEEMQKLKSQLIELNSLRAKVAELSADKEKLAELKNITAQEEQVNTLKTRIDELIIESKNKTEEIENLKKKIVELEQKNKEYEEEIILLKKTQAPATQINSTNVVIESQNINNTENLEEKEQEQEQEHEQKPNEELEQKDEQEQEQKQENEQKEEQEIIQENDLNKEQEINKVHEENHEQEKNEEHEQEQKEENGQNQEQGQEQYEKHDINKNEEEEKCKEQDENQKQELNENQEKKEEEVERTKGNIIHNTNELEMIIKKINKNNKKLILNLLYKATADSDKAEAFHAKCDKAESSIVLVETDKGKRFGGYTSKNWRGNCIEKKDENAFVFSLDKMKTYDNIIGEDAIGCYPKFGPIFLGCQIRIFNNAFTQGGTTFEKNLNFKTEEDFELTGGDRQFNIKEIEVYEVVTATQ